MLYVRFVIPQSLSQCCLDLAFFKLTKFNLTTKLRRATDSYLSKVMLVFTVLLESRKTLFLSNNVIISSSQLPK